MALQLLIKYARMVRASGWWWRGKIDGRQDTGRGESHARAAAKSILLHFNETRVRA
jgi:hypothetical protein